MQYASLHGGRVTWDATCFAFAMAVDPSESTEVLAPASATNWPAWHLVSVRDAQPPLHWSIGWLVCCCLSPQRLTNSGSLQLQVAVQIGNVATSLGDRLWATWFSSAAQYARSTSPVAVLRINVQVCHSTLVKPHQLTGY